MVGRRGVVHHAIDPEGTVKVAAELWSARAPGGPIAEGVEIRVTAMDGFTMIVEPATAPAAEDAPLIDAPPTPDGPPESAGV